MLSWKANCSRWSATRSRVAVIRSPEEGRRTPALDFVIPSVIIGINRRSVNDTRGRRFDTSRANDIDAGEPQARRIAAWRPLGSGKVWSGRDPHHAGSPVALRPSRDRRIDLARAPGGPGARRDVEQLRTDRAGR